MRRYAVALALFAALGVGSYATAALAQSGGDVAANENEKVTICHRTESQSRPFVKIEISQHALREHMRHGDTTPDAAGNCPTTANGGTTGTTGTTGGTTGTTGTVQQRPKVTLCHRTKSKKKPFVKVRVSERAVAAHLRHGDVMPNANGDCPSNGSTNAKKKGKKG